MNFKIVYFDDEINYRTNFVRLFAGHDTQFKFYDLDCNPDVLQERCIEISRFQPTFIVVDLIKQHAAKTEVRDPGVRIIRYIMDSSPTCIYPVIAYSRALKNNASGNPMIQTVREYGAKTILRVMNPHAPSYPTAERFFEAAGIQFD